MTVGTISGYKLIMRDFHQTQLDSGRKGQAQQPSAESSRASDSSSTPTRMQSQLANIKLAMAAQRAAAEIDARGLLRK